MNSARLIAVETLEDVLYKGAYSNIALNNKLNRSNLGLKDRGLVTEIVYGTLKYKFTIDSILGHFLRNGLNSMDNFILNILRMSIYQIKYLDKIPEFAVVNEAVELSKKRSNKFSKLVNGVLRNYLRNKDGKYCNTQNYIDRLCFDYSFEPWMTKLFVEQYGKDMVEGILGGLNAVPKITVGINNLKTNFDKVWNELIENGYNLEKGIICKDAIIINRGSNLEKNTLFKEGMISVQDESAMLAAASTDAGKGMIVLDMCSAPGGKTSYMAGMMKNTGTIYAFDIYSSKIKLIKGNLNRLGIKNVRTSLQNAEIYNPEMEKIADRIIADVPCSGLGIIRKKPEIKWNKDILQLNNITDIQKKILSNSAKYLKTGGKLVYSTCTLNKLENEENVNWFIRNNPEFTVEELDFGSIDNVIYHDEGYVTILPDKNMDGFFIAKIKKNI
ncbi:MAG: 16S rRNA (cytosine(967)-C(5))-methyltransferase RsmB [Clostridium sp.]|jgi:16S rRNA (cytosine967-C5)-methyltransferase|uniref:16S rRNA (cytosine(967)-C(5))-methyltransferase RsmB n=1 Tax=Clostridium sp. TaxID=1506 RepID=UPI0025C2DD0C|nr:16S rRNA (cytosine(967)-C(5))-methyltransferase RsmB [Clostridium sp.]MCH3964039.1 16S rRNA (cytosine(967)-C(5))-methyltransferase RsmB [Clostridium sp.]MCI1716240.1 16S rRNA (cytosine(967)-C(5))-methyltransferase RsmB [Clostridium sp.]MCI1800520.1 16S rRNA (cytosine(967)-C(5))-methyltransferase RsmB [Clostridium sp.]MCI1814417.1 16S rRNA (cytosine(967)-C(5))-methyltransferase RsmB [Clostridium sp.]MCI1871316.1 16S rRNA (cytosine(967)-C(5))-methyltransferase RsmB [Clostridium sp.]